MFDCLGKQCWELLQCPETLQAHRVMISEAVSHRNAVSLTLGSKRKNGESFINDLTITPIANGPCPLPSFSSNSYPIVFWISCPPFH